VSWILETAAHPSQSTCSGRRKTMWHQSKLGQGRGRRERGTVGCCVLALLCTASLLAVAAGDPSEECSFVHAASCHPY
jgi:hypothetical protein